jgi:hypothetical protein
MPRQPFLPLITRKPGGKVDVGSLCIGRRPKLESLIGNCLMAWSFVEAEMALLLAHLIGADRTEAMLAVFNSLRRSTNQRAAIAECAPFSLSETSLELLTAILSIHKSLESERTALAHGHFGTYDKLPDIILWMDTNTYSNVKTRVYLARQALTQKFIKEFYAKISVYRQDDLTSILREFNALEESVVIFMRYLINATAMRAQLYVQLCNRPRIAQELETIRQKNARATSPVSPPQAGGGLD